MILNEKSDSNGNSNRKVKIEYPTDWGFKIIGRDENALKDAIKEVMGNKKHTCHFGNYSKNGKFCSYNTSCEVESEDERNRLFKAFSNHKDIKMVI